MAQGRSGSFTSGISKAQRRVSEAPQGNNFQRGDREAVRGESRDGVPSSEGTKNLETFTVRYERDGASKVFECKAEDLEKIWRRIENKFCKELTPEDHLRLAEVKKRWKIPN